MKTRQERKMMSLLKQLTLCNPKVPFLYDKNSRIIADSKYLDSKSEVESTVANISMPSGYYVLNLLNSENKVGYICDGSEAPVATLIVDNSAKSKDEKMYNGYTEYMAKETPIRDFFSRTANKIRNEVKYFFSKRSSMDEDLNKLANRNKKETVLTDSEKEKNFEKALKKINEQNKEIKKEEPKKVEPKKVEPKKVEPKKEEPKKNKKEEYLNKKYELLAKEAYSKLGTFEKMFIDDAKAECLVPSDNEFNMMLNERTVNKEAILNYYAQLEDLKTKKSLDGIKYDFIETKESLNESFTNLGEYERMFIEDAFAENLELGDNEFNMMLNERTVNKDQVISFMKNYKENLLKQKELIDNYAKISNTDTKDFSLYTINALRKELASNKKMLTKQELEKQKANKLKKGEIVDILNRIEAKKQQEETVRKISL